MFTSCRARLYLFKLVIRVKREGHFLVNPDVPFGCDGSVSGFRLVISDSPLSESPNDSCSAVVDRLGRVVLGMSVGIDHRSESFVVASTHVAAIDRL